MKGPQVGGAKVENYSVAPQFWPRSAPRPVKNGFAVASLAMGVFSIWPLMGIGPILALVFGFVARHQIARSGGMQTGRSMASAGIALGVIGLALMIGLMWYIAHARPMW